MNVQREFWRRLKEEWLPAYCNERGYDPKGFRDDAKKITDIDARDFLRAIDNKVVSVDPGGRFRMPQSNTKQGGNSPPVRLIDNPQRSVGLMTYMFLRGRTAKRRKATASATGHARCSSGMFG